MTTIALQRVIHRDYRDLSVFAILAIMTSFGLYIVALVGITLSLSTTKILQKDIVTEKSSLATLERSYLLQEEGVSIDTAHTLGLSKVTKTSFAKQSSLASY